MTRAELEIPATLTDAQALERHQLARFNDHLRRARAGQYYARLFEGLPERVTSLGEIQRFPLTRKSDILRDLEAHPLFGSRGAPSAQALRHIVTTSGTSGAGQEVYPLDEADEDAIYQMEARGFAWAGIGPGSVVLNTIPMTTTAAGQWYYEGLRLLGATILQVGPLPTERKAEYLQRFRADTIIGTPSYVFRLAAVLRQSGNNPAELDVRRLVLAGESWSPDWLRTFEQAWNAKAYEQYGCTQRAIAWNCERGALTDGDRGTLHTLPDHAIYEVIDPATGTAAAEGEFGELVVTPFCSSAAPLVRFATGDRVQVAPACPCGRTGVGFVSGRVDRYDFMVKVRGVNLWPEALDQAVFSVRGVTEYQAEVLIDADGREILRVTFEAPDAGVGSLVHDAVRQKTGLNAQTECVPSGQITANIAGNFVKRTRLRDLRGGKS